MANIFCEQVDPLVIRFSHPLSESAVGAYFIDKYRKGAAERGYGVVAAQLRKQGVPLNMALRILGFRSRV